MTPLSDEMVITAEKLSQMRCGVHLPIETLTVSAVQNAFQTLVNDGTYRKNMQAFSQRVYRGQRTVENLDGPRRAAEIILRVASQNRASLDGLN
jgi:UDP:flavonoid glycosyltransferase YjiC (YdhE family)